MSSKYQNCTRQECKIHSLAILEHVIQKWKSAVHLAESGDYGSAIGFQIVSMEELVKSVVLAFDSTGYDFRKVKGMDDLFKNHGLRHVISYFIYAFGTVMEDLKSFVEKFQSEPEKLIELLNGFHQHEKKFSYYLKRKLVQFNNALAWFTGIDEVRQSSLYTDFSGKFTSPKTISKEQYQQQYILIFPAIWFGEMMIKTLCEDEEARRSIGNVIPRLVQRRIYKAIELSLQAVKKGGKKPIEALKEQLEKVGTSSYELNKKPLASRLRRTDVLSS